MTVYLAEHVETTTYGHRGRVTAIHRECPESDLWLAGQRGLGDNPLQYADGPWVSVLVHGGGSIAVPNLPEFINPVEPFPFTNLWASDYFRPTTNTKEI